MAKQNYFTLNIPVKPHTKEYLRKFYDTPYTLSQRDDLGLQLFHILRRRMFRNEKYYSLEACTETFEVRISRKYVFDRACRLLSDYQVHLFNSCIEQMMMRHALIYIDGRRQSGDNKLKEYIYDWMAEYNVYTGSKDWLHRIKKKYQRYQKKQEKKTEKVPPAMSLEKSSLNITFNSEKRLSA